MSEIPVARCRCIHGPLTTAECFVIITLDATLKHSTRFSKTQHARCQDDSISQKEVLGDLWDDEGSLT
jgi:hypothetical protein